MEQAPETENNNDPEETKILPPAPISGNRNPPSFSAISKVLDSVSTIDQLNTAIGDVIVAAATRTKLDPDGNLASVPEIVDVPVERPSAVPSTQILKKGSSGTIKAKSSPYLSVCGYPREIWNGNIPVNLLEVCMHQLCRIIHITYLHKNSKAHLRLSYLHSKNYSASCLNI